ncbi:hypothetical protein EZS27_029390 [termite gut metagenome]|uniref:Restriction endonuclease type IV Mrr domain-containing protein n=1 Tax=termite gut metagenome TaxID=433724 RepID=A0A5J4QH40_9ZZZZ
MKFKNKFEETIFNITQRVFGGDNAHNETIQIEDKTSKSVVSFTGPPKKEIDVLCVNLSDDLKVKLLISCKDFSKSKAEPAHAQEWCSVLNMMNKHAVDSKYLGVIVSSRGFTAGCEAWASADNIGLIPPIKGNNLSFSEQQIVRMFERFCLAISRRLKFPFDDIFEAPIFFDFCFTIAADFERFASSDTTSRYKIINKDWDSNFSEFVRYIVGKQIISLTLSKGKYYLLLNDNSIVTCSANQIEFGEAKEINLDNEDVPVCSKNMDNQVISFEEIKSKIIGAKISSAADFQSHIELGIDGILNLGLVPPNNIYVMIFDEIT